MIGRDGALRELIPRRTVRTAAVLGLLRHDCALRTTEALQAGAQECLVLSDLTTGSAVCGHCVRASNVSAVHQRLADLALRDELTGLYNRRGFRDRRATAARVPSSRAQPVGGAGGRRWSEVDQRCVRACRRRPGDCRHRLDSPLHLPRIGLVATAATSSWPSADADRASTLRVAARLDEALAQHTLRSKAPYALSLSSGFSVLEPPDRPTLNDLLESADHALYASKRRRVLAPTWTGSLAAADLRRTVAA